MNVKRYFLTTLVLSAVILLIGCSKPVVKHSAISGEVRQIQSWRLVCDNIEGIDEADYGKVERPRPQTEKNEYSQFEYCTRFVEKVRMMLFGKYELNVAENFPQTGTIHLMLKNEKLSSYVPPADTSNTYQDISPSDRVGRQSSELNLVAATSSLFTDDDYINGVTVTVTDLDERILGQVFVGGEPGDRVKADFLAKIIDEVIRTGRYKGAKGIGTAIGGNVIP